MRTFSLIFPTNVDNGGRVSETFKYFIIRKTYSSFCLTLFGSRTWLPRKDALRGVVREFRFQKGEIFL
jgi:hypothetical protein